MAWWIWASLGLVFLVLEIFIPSGFFLLFFGVAALLTAAFSAVLSGYPEMHWIFFCVASVFSIFFFRKLCLQKMGKSPVVIDTLIGQFVTVTSDCAPGAQSKGELRGSSWSVFNAGTEPLTAGQRVRVEKVDGLTLHVTKA